MGNETSQVKALKEILIADEDAKMLQHLETLLSKFYSVRTVQNGNNAIELLQKGFKPAVLLVSQQLLGLPGGQLLAESQKFVPDAIRIITTSFIQPKEIIPAMSQGKAYMYLRKPINDLQFIQTIRNCAEHYDSQQKVKVLQKNLTISLTELKKLKSEPQVNDNKADGGIIGLFSNLISLSESLYFSVHTQNVVQIVNTLGSELHLAEPKLSLLEAAAKLHLIVYIAMPERLRLRDPHEIDESEIPDYFIFFRKPLNTLRNNKEFTAIVKIIENLWERMDGTGLPAGLNEETIPIESQILQLAVLYDNICYRLPYEKLSAFRQSEESIQTQVETHERHNEAMKFIYRNSGWFDKDLLRIFTFVEKNRTNNALVPKRGDLKLRNKEYFAPKIEISPDGGGAPAAEAIETIVKIGDRKFAEKPVMIQDLKPDMIVSNNIVSKSGMLIVRQEQKLTENLIQNIQQLFMNDQLRDSVSILIPYKEKN